MELQTTIELAVRIVGVLTLCGAGLAFTTVIMWVATEALWKRLRLTHDLALLWRVIRRLSRKGLLRSTRHEN